MPTRKQRRRQQKTRRHEWEYVYVDDEGNEVDVDPSELPQAKADRPQARNGRAQKSTRAQPSRQRAGRAVQPPSWRRVGRRALLIGPVVVIAMMLLNRNMPLGSRIGPAIILLAFFLPFSYFTDSLAYRMYKKRIDRDSGGPPRAKKS